MRITMPDIKAALRKKMAAKAAGTWHGFAALRRKLAARRGKRKVWNPGALAAFIGRKKFGKKSFAAMGVAGRRGISRD